MSAQIEFAMRGSNEYVSFDRVADVYEETRYIPPEWLDAAAGVIVEDGGFGPGARFLDAGVGTGRFARALAAQRLRVVGCDISERMLRRAHAQAGGVSVVRADLRRLPLRPASFRGALMVHVLHLIVEWQRALEEVQRALTPDGCLYLASEGGKSFRTRGIYFQMANERGLSRPHLGAQSLQEILAHLLATGADVDQIDHGRVRWTARMRVEDMVRTIRANAFSHMWHVPPDVHAKLATDVEAVLEREGIAYDEVEEAEAHIAIFRARWS